MIKVSTYFTGWGDVAFAQAVAGGGGVARGGSFPSESSWFPQYDVVHELPECPFLLCGLSPYATCLCPWSEGGWGPISGICEPGEEITATALREVKEEIGLDGRIEALLGVGQVASAARRPARRAPQDPPPVTPQVSRIVRRLHGRPYVAGPPQG